MKKCKLVQNIRNFKFCYFIFCTMICLVVFPVSTSAQENSDHVIRVGSFEETYNVVNEKGERSGYGYEYLQDIAGYAGWTYKYITSDWKNCFTQLENGEIDILGDISYTDERAENMLFSDMPMGEEKYYIYTDASNMDLTAGNLDSFEGKNIGVSKDNIVEDVLNEWESKYGLHTQHVNVSNTTEIMDKLSKHEIDCFVSVEESRWEESDISPLTSIGETEIYFAINPERPDIKEALDSAMRRIKDDNPFYTDDLYRRYLSAQSSSFLSKEEREWIGQAIVNYIGDYDYYLEKKDEMTRIYAPAQETAAQEVKENVSETKLTWQQQKEEQALKRKRENELKKVEARIEELEARDKEIDETMVLPDICTNVAECTKLSREKAAIAEELEGLYEKWEELA